MVRASTGIVVAGPAVRAFVADVTGDGE